MVDEVTGADVVVDRPSEGVYSVEKSSLSLDRASLLAAADAKGVLKISAPKLAEISGVSVQCAWKWAKGVRVRQSSHEKILRALGLDN